MIPFIGLTGGIGAGKSTALDVLERLGAAGLSTDRVVHELYETPELRDAVAEHFGPDVLAAGEIDRPALARAAFDTDDQRAWLEGMLWPRVRERVAQWRRDLEHAPQPPRAAVVEVPLLFEAGMAPVFDATIAVVADEGVRHQRASSRGHLALEQRTARQLSQEEKSGLATYTVVNDGTVDDLEGKLSAILEMLKS